MTRLSLTRPDDWHIHLREGAALKMTVPHAQNQFARAIVMPNLTTPVTTTAQALNYRDEILAACDPKGPDFTPLMTLYLTDNTSAEEINKAKASGHIHAVKLYPAGATTNSAAGVTDLNKVYPALEAMQSAGLPLLVHGEITTSETDIFDRERAFIDQQLSRIVADFPELRVVFEHITTEDAVQFVLDHQPLPDTPRQGASKQGASRQLAATITAHHLMINRNAMLVGGIQPHHYCLPVAKRECHRLALVKAATSGHAAFFLGTDSAPHEHLRKESACGCAGIYTAHAAIELYAQVFDEADALDKLEAFASHNGPAFYQLAANTATITLQRKPWQVDAQYPFDEGFVIPFMADKTLNWRLQNTHTD